MDVDSPHGVLPRLERLSCLIQTFELRRFCTELFALSIIELTFSPKEDMESANLSFMSPLLAEFTVFSIELFALFT